MPLRLFLLSLATLLLLSNAVEALSSSPIHSLQSWEIEQQQKYVQGLSPSHSPPPLGSLWSFDKDCMLPKSHCGVIEARLADDAQSAPRAVVKVLEAHPVKEEAEHSEARRRRHGKKSSSGIGVPQRRQRRAKEREEKESAAAVPLPKEAVSPAAEDTTSPKRRPMRVQENEGDVKVPEQGDKDGKKRIRRKIRRTLEEILEANKKTSERMKDYWQSLDPGERERKMRGLKNSPKPKTTTQASKSPPDRYIKR